MQLRLEICALYLWNVNFITCTWTSSYPPWGCPVNSIDCNIVVNQSEHFNCALRTYLARKLMVTFTVSDIMMSELCLV